MKKAAWVAVIGLVLACILYDVISEVTASRFLAYWRGTPGAIGLLIAATVGCGALAVVVHAQSPGVRRWFAVVLWGVANAALSGFAAFLLYASLRIAGFYLHGSESATWTPPLSLVLQMAAGAAFVCVLVVTSWWCWWRFRCRSEQPVAAS